MKKSRVGKRILAWMLVFAMLWQSAGVETLAASITASDGVGDSDRGRRGEGFCG